MVAEEDPELPDPPPHPDTAATMNNTANDFGRRFGDWPVGWIASYRAVWECDSRRETQRIGRDIMSGRGTNGDFDRNCLEHRNGARQGVAILYRVGEFGLCMQLVECKRHSSPRMRDARAKLQLQQLSLLTDLASGAHLCTIEERPRERLKVTWSQALQDTGYGNAE